MFKKGIVFWDIGEFYMKKIVIFVVALILLSFFALAGNEGHLGAEGELCGAGCEVRVGEFLDLGEGGFLTISVNPSEGLDFSIRVDSMDYEGGHFLTFTHSETGEESSLFIPAGTSDEDAVSMIKSELVKYMSDEKAQKTAEETWKNLKGESNEEGEDSNDKGSFIDYGDGSCPPGIILC